MVRVSIQTGVLTEKCQEEALFHPLQVNSKSPVGRDTVHEPTNKQTQKENPQKRSEESVEQ